MSIATCYREIKRYENLKKNVKVIISHLEDANKYNDILIKKIKDNYNINNDGTVIYDRCKSFKSNISDTINYLKNNIIRAIEKAILKLQHQITNLKQEMEQTSFLTKE